MLIFLAFLVHAGLVQKSGNTGSAAPSRVSYALFAWRTNMAGFERGENKPFSRFRRGPR